MARTKRKISERTRQWLLAPDINHATGKTHEVSKAWGRHRARLLRGQDGVESHGIASTAVIDRFGGFKIERWCTASSKRNSDVSRKRRIAGKHSINVGIEDHFDALEDAGKIFNWKGDDQEGDYWEQLAAEQLHQEYLDELEDLRLEEEYNREMSYDGYDYYYDEPWDEMY